MIYVLIIFGIIFLETAIKRTVRKNGKEVSHGQKPIAGKADGIFMITHLENKGAAGGILEKKGKVVTAGALALLGTVLALLAGQWITFRPKITLEGIGFALIFGGGLSNLSDRICRGSVTDYIRFPGLTVRKLSRLVFNISDFCIFIGVGIYAVSELLKKS